MGRLRIFLAIDLLRRRNQLQRRISERRGCSGRWAGIVGRICPTINCGIQAEVNREPPATNRSTQQLIDPQILRLTVIDGFSARTTRILFRPNWKVVPNCYDRKSVPPVQNGRLSKSPCNQQAATKSLRVLRPTFE